MTLAVETEFRPPQSEAMSRRPEALSVLGRVATICFVDPTEREVITSAIDNCTSLKGLTTEILMGFDPDHKDPEVRIRGLVMVQSLYEGARTFLGVGRDGVPCADFCSCPRKVRRTILNEARKILPEIEGDLFKAGEERERVRTSATFKNEPRQGMTGIYPWSRRTIRAQGKDPRAKRGTRRYDREVRTDRQPKSVVPLLKVEKIEF